MNRTSTIKPPFFEFGPKAYLYGRNMLSLAEHADRIAHEFDVDIIITPQYVDIPLLARSMRHIHVFAQHMDPIVPGRGIGAVLPEALVEAGAEGVLLNHAEKRMALSDIKHAVERADEVGLTTIVCADSPEEAAAAAHFAPNIILAESPELIGGGTRGPEDAVVIRRTNELVKAVNPDVLVLHGAGIKDEQDVYAVIAAGADATGSTSAIVKADDPKTMFERMIEAVRRAWDDRNKK
jgi:triosephosphate isomerase